MEKHYSYVAEVSFRVEGTTKEGEKKNVAMKNEFFTDSEEEAKQMVAALGNGPKEFEGMGLQVIVESSCIINKDTNVRTNYPIEILTEE